MFFSNNMNFQYFFFDTYIGYFLQVLPISIIVGLIYWIIMYKNDKDTKLSRKIFSTLFISYATGLICLVLGLNIISNLWYRVLYHMNSGNVIRFFEFDYNLIPHFYTIDGEVVGNVLIFIPFGILYPLSKENISFKKTLITGLTFTLCIELLQPIFARAFDINDVILNALGIVISSIIFFTIKKIKYGK